jgi:hypothetical protein
VGDRLPGQEEAALAGFGVGEVGEEGRRFRTNLVGVGVQQRCRSLSFTGSALYQREYDNECGRPRNDGRPACA